MTKAAQLEKAAKTYIERLVLPSEPERPLWNRENMIFRKPARWNYIDGCMIRAVTMLYELCGDERLLEYAVKFVNFYVGKDGTIPTMKASDYNLDNINGGKNLLYLSRKTKDGRYRQAAERLYTEQLEKQPRLSCGSYWHKAVYPNQIWLDGTYMALPFMAEYAQLSGRHELLDDICLQLKNIRSIMRDSVSGLYFHGYDEMRKMPWADPVTGLSQEFWLRAMGWLCAALADLSELISEDHETGTLCREMLAELLESLTGCLTPEGTLCQLPLRRELAGNYIETSGTLLFAYSAMKAGRLGIVGEKIRISGENALSASEELYMEYDGEGIPVLKNICLMAGLGGSPLRDGSAEYYLREKITENDAKGIAPYLMACTELKRLYG